MRFLGVLVIVLLAYGLWVTIATDGEAWRIALGGGALVCAVLAARYDWLDR